jgi:hypothetical protein
MKAYKGKSKMPIVNETVVYAKRVEDTFVFDCSWCNGQHIHSAKEGRRSSHCASDKSPSGYIVKEAK